MLDSLNEKTVLITGGTRGIGLATGLAFGAQGARVTLTHRWGSADEDTINAAFSAAGAPLPRIVEANAADADDTVALLDLFPADQGIDIFVSNVAVASPVEALSDYVKRDIFRAIEFTTWPMVAYLQAMERRFDRLPRYVIGLSSPGHLTYIHRYDAVALAKSMLETLCKYLARRLGPQGTRVNIVRAGYVDTEALETVVGAQVLQRIRQDAPDYIVPVEQVARAIVGLCSGFMDGVNGHILDVDQGCMFNDSLIRAFEGGTAQKSPAS